MPEISDPYKIFGLPTISRAWQQVMGESYGMRVAKHAIEGLFQVFKFIFWD
jgi:hypothetical protein